MAESTKDTVLIVEDAGGFRDIYRTVLEAEDYEVLEAEDGKKGLELIRERKPSMILLIISTGEWRPVQPHVITMKNQVISMISGKIVHIPGAMPLLEQIKPDALQRKPV